MFGSAKKQEKREASPGYVSEKRLMSYFLPYKGLFIGGMLCSAGVAGIQVWFIKLIYNVVHATIYSDHRNLDLAAISIVGAHVVKWLLAYGQTYFISSATQKIAVQLRNDLYTHLQRLSLSYFENTKVGDLLSRMTNDVGLVQSAGPQIVQLVNGPLLIIGCLCMILYWNWKLTLISLLVLPFMALAINRIGSGMRRLSQLLQIRLSDVASVVQETLSTVRVVKSFGMEEHEVTRFAEVNERTYKSAMRSVKRNAAMGPTLELIGVCSIAFVLWCGGHMVVPDGAKGGFEASTLIGFLLALEKIATAVRELGRFDTVYHQTMAGAQRIFDVLDEVPAIQDKPDAVVFDSIAGLVEFRNVSFSYNTGEPVLDGISFTAEPGQQVALVGPSGAGKSTIANLIPRFYDVTGGAVLVDERDVRDVTLNSLRRQIGIVPQETMLFSTTIRENIAYGKMDATDEEIMEAAKAANAHDFISKLPDGYHTTVGERGTRLSGGERQRVAIARALLKNPKLLILDEATSSLDVASEAIVQDALERLMRNRTTVVIAHRLSTIVGADKILVMRGGRIVESGTHSELLGLGGLYADLYSTQSKGGSPGAAIVDVEEALSEA